MTTAEKVLEQPYTITIDGQPTRDFFIFEDKIRGENAAQINYQHSSHEISVTGTNVVSEFPLHIVGAIAGAIGIVAIVTRITSFKKIS